MTVNINVFWGSSDSDTYRSQTPPTRGLLQNSPKWDSLFDFSESIDPQSSLALLQGPLPPCTYEPNDDWLVEFRRLQDVHNRAQAVGAPTTLYHTSSCQPSDVSDRPSQPQRRSQDKFPKIDGRGVEGSRCRTYQPTHQPTPTHAAVECDVHFPQYLDEQACVRDEPGCAATPSLTRGYSSPSRSPQLYDWNLTPTPLGDNDVQKAMKGLKEFERNLQADTKRRISQVEQSRPG
ncbi:hypothetical protein F4860DRAFT_457815 [Xylaria cubensis]|nr:hypothetical protein F4860DRAFT_457815 [Xylaria cubensis]